MAAVRDRSVRRRAKWSTSSRCAIPDCTPARWSRVPGPRRGAPDGRCTVVGLLAATGGRQVRDRVRPRPRAGHGSRHRPRRRRWVRVEGWLRLPAGRRRDRLGGSPARPTGALGGDPLRVDAVDGSWSRVDSSGAHRRAPRRQGAGLRGGGRPGQRRLPGDGHVHHAPTCATRAPVCTTSRRRGSAADPSSPTPRRPWHCAAPGDRRQRATSSGRWIASPR